MTSDRKRVAITRRIHERAREILEQAGFEVWINPEPRALTRDELRRVLCHFDAMICLLNDRIDAQLLEEATRVRLIANYAVGYDNFDVEAATRRGVALTNTPDVLTNATAELAWALLFAAARHVAAGDRFVREGRFHGWDPLLLLGHEIAGKALGIVGAGRIGTAMAKRAVGFDMRILYTKRSGPSPQLDALGAKFAALDDLLRESDFVSIHTPLTPETHHLINREKLGLMKPTAILVNTGRGPVVDEAALAEALAEGRLAAAGLDVYEREPVVEQRLLGLPNVVLLPHIGSATYEARAAMAELAALNILDFFEGRVPRTCINPEYVRYAAKS
jgi:D-3-phosphoglycerate dehydrogenase